MSYRNAIIYQIICKINPDIRYIGSTFNSLRNRWQTHKYDFEYWQQGKRDGISIYKYFLEIGIENFKILEIKSYLVYSENVKDTKHISAYEQLWINKIKCVNQHSAFNIPVVSEHLRKQYKKKYYEENKEVLNENHRTYYEENRTKILAQKKEYRKKNLEKLKAKGQERVECPCGGRYKLRDRLKHSKTKIHIQYLENQKIQE